MKNQSNKDFVLCIRLERWDRESRDIQDVCMNDEKFWFFPQARKGNWVVVRVASESSPAPNYPIFMRARWCSGTGHRGKNKKNSRVRLPRDNIPAAAVFFVNNFAYLAEAEKNLRLERISLWNFLFKNFASRYLLVELNTTSWNKVSLLREQTSFFLFDVSWCSKFIRNFIFHFPFSFAHFPPSISLPYKSLL